MKHTAHGTLDLMLDSQRQLKTPASERPLPHATSPVRPALHHSTACQPSMPCPLPPAPSANPRWRLPPTHPPIPPTHRGIHQKHHVAAAAICCQVGTLHSARRGRVLHLLQPTRCTRQLQRRGQGGGRSTTQGDGAYRLVLGGCCSCLQGTGGGYRVGWDRGVSAG
jgi:hypothetical protein